VPVTRGGELLGVLDVDSPHVAAFSEAEAARLEHLVRDVFDPA
jgi:putative methionine-R-sulfoxide reductase with GAF domain